MTPQRISCIAHANNHQELASIFESFEKQIYENKELIVGVPDSLQVIIPPRSVDVQIVRHKNGNHDIKRILALSTGELLCSWNANAWHHRLRLLRQHRAMQETKKDGCSLTSILLYSAEDDIGYVSFPDLYESTLLCTKDAYLDYAKIATCGPPLSTVLLQQNRLYGIIDPLLYVSLYDQDKIKNFNRFHHAGQSKKLPPTAVAALKEVIKYQGDDLHSREATIVLRSIDNFHWIKKFPPFPSINLSHQEDFTDWTF